MKHSQLSLTILLLTGLLGTARLPAQPGPPGGGRGGAGPQGRIYDPQTVETLTGQVIKVETLTPTPGMGRGVHLLVKTGEKQLPVHLGPAWFIDNQEFQIQPQDQVTVTGSRVKLNGEEVLVAAEVTDGAHTLKLRDGSGIPVWAGWRRGGGGAGMGAGGGMMGSAGMGTNWMSYRRQMLAEHEKMLAEMQQMDEELDQKVAQMNEAEGNAKVKAMAAVINDLVKERKMMHQHMAELHSRMMSHVHPMPGGVGGAEAVPSGTETGSSAPAQQE